MVIKLSDLSLRSNGLARTLWFGDIGSSHSGSTVQCLERPVANSTRASGHTIGPDHLELFYHACRSTPRPVTTRSLSSGLSTLGPRNTTVRITVNTGSLRHHFRHLRHCPGHRSRRAGVGSRDGPRRQQGEGPQRGAGRGDGSSRDLHGQRVGGAAPHGLGVGLGAVGAGGRRGRGGHGARFHDFAAEEKFALDWHIVLVITSLTRLWEVASS